MGASTSNTDGRRKKRPGVEEQTAIITQAAVTLFAEQGVSAVSIAQVCARAGVSRPTFYRCFEDKDALVSRIYEESVNTYVEEFLAGGVVGEAGPLKTRLDELLESIFRHAEIAQLVFRESGDPDSPAARIIDTALEHATDTMLTQSRGRSRDKPSRVYLKSIMAAVQWIVHDAIRKGATPAAKAAAKHAAYTLVSRARS